MFGKMDVGTGRLKDGRRYKGSEAPDSQTTTAEPWSGAKPYLENFMQVGKSVTQNPFQFYNGDTVAGFSPEQEMGMSLATQRAMAGSPTLNAANNQVTNTLNGDYLNPDSNPYLKGTVDRALGDVQTRVNSQFNNNNFGSTAHQETLSRNLGDQANQIYGQNYNAERNNQMDAIGQAQGLASADYADAYALQSVGAQRQGLANQYLGLNQNTFNQAAQWPYEQLQRYGNVVSQGTGVGGTTTTTGQQGGGDSSPMGGMMGGAAAGTAIMPGWGTAIGAGLGLLLG
jgi:hypothetical protein